MCPEETEVGHEVIEPETHDDADSTLSSDMQSSTASLTASIIEYRTIHGRTFHSQRGPGDAEYWAPNDNQHNTSMDIQHHVWTLLLDGELYLAPLPDEAGKVLDIGTGTGIWAIDFADEHPEAVVVGVDLSPTQPEWVPPNCKFEIDDVSLDWTWHSDEFDFVHLRTMFGSFTDWQHIFNEAYRVCKPGGYVEDFEASADLISDDGTVTRENGTALGQWGKLFHEAGWKTGRSMAVFEEDTQVKCMKAAGFVDIVVKDIKCPLGQWPKDPKQKEIGSYDQLAVEEGLEGYVIYMFNNILGWSMDEVQVYLAKAHKNDDEPAKSPIHKRVLEIPGEMAELVMAPG
ncbi:hypothetical protein G7Z17_g3425 [Cylindrodendrum hubeiense]|uniref:Uncharacterized protein n=1 Tax=Cylindrodendrum hubeiense TaxID=595255 RepID=A0A9P5LJC0_9HYPO|nr:hypothetical protein G7Z17_g3425 [Cylindrodendrum hubeiense]